MDLTKDSSQIRKWGKKEEEKSQAPRGIWTQDHLIARRVLYLCATTTAQMPLFGSKRKMFIGTGAIFISPHIFAFLYYLLSLGNRFEDLLCLLVTPPNLTRWSILLRSYYHLGFWGIVCASCPPVLGSNLTAGKIEPNLYLSFMIWVALKAPSRKCISMNDVKFK